MDIVSVSHPGQAGPASPDVQGHGSLRANSELIKTVQEINASQLLGQDSELTLAIDQQTRLPVIRVISRQTHQVVMQLPAEYILQLHRSLESRPDTYERSHPGAAEQGGSGPSNSY